MITKDMPIGKVVKEYPETIAVFQEHGLHCMGCAIAHFENIEQGCSAHGIEADKLVEDINKTIEAKKKKN